MTSHDIIIFIVAGICIAAMIAMHIWSKRCSWRQMDFFEKHGYFEEDKETATESCEWCGYQVYYPCGTARHRSQCDLS